MPELTPKERLQPCLLDRLSDDAPGTQADSREDRVMSLRQYREAVLRDVAWLLNATRYESAQPLDDYPEVQRSVVNYGVAELSGREASSLDPRDLERQVAEAIRRFEPRIAPASLNVEIERDQTKMSKWALILRIEGQLWATPTPEALYLRTAIDLETGDVELVSKSNG